MEKNKICKVRISEDIHNSYKNMCNEDLQTMSKRIRKFIDLDLKFRKNGIDLIKKINSLYENE